MRIQQGLQLGEHPPGSGQDDGRIGFTSQRQAGLHLRGGGTGFSPTESFAVMTPSGPRWTGRVELIPYMLDV